MADDVSSSFADAVARTSLVGAAILGGVSVAFLLPGSTAQSWSVLTRELRRTAARPDPPRPTGAVPALVPEAPSPAQGGVRWANSVSPAAGHRPAKRRTRARPTATAERERWRRRRACRSGRCGR
jgi:hypothetical protein